MPIHGSSAGCWSSSGACSQSSIASRIAFAPLAASPPSIRLTPLTVVTSSFVAGRRRQGHEILHFGVAAVAIATRLAGDERCEHGVGKEPDCVLGPRGLCSRIARGGGEDGVTLHDRAVACGDQAGQPPTRARLRRR